MSSKVLDVKRTIAVGDEVTFTVASDPNNQQKQLAIRIKHLEPGTVKFDLVIAKDVTGTVDQVIFHPTQIYLTVFPNA